MKNSAKVAIAGAILLIGSPVLGVAVTFAGMLRVLNSAAESTGTPIQEGPLGVSIALISTLVITSLTLIGLCLLIGGIVTYLAGGPENTAEKQEA